MIGVADFRVKFYRVFWCLTLNRNRYNIFVRSEDSGQAGEEPWLLRPAEESEFYVRFLSPGTGDLSF